ncbi:MAG: transcription antitermination factor NusB [Acidimicrobiales bacterium]
MSDDGPSLPAGPRRQARERALSLLYEAEAKDLTPAEVLADLPIDPEEFAAGLVAGVGERMAEIDALLERFSVGWPVGRMPVIDRNVLRLAVFELLAHAETPVGAVLSEAVELAKSYSTEESGRFVNGVLSSVAAEVRGS